MLPPLLDKTRPHPADPWLWALMAVLVVGQVVAFWMVCSSQVERQQVREAALRSGRTEQVALRGPAMALPSDTKAQAGPTRRGDRPF